MKRRIVITGMGLQTPLGNTLEEFESAIKKGQSGIRKNQAMIDMGLSCHLSGWPEIDHDEVKKIFDKKAKYLVTNDVIYACLAGISAWLDAGLSVSDAEDSILWDTGAVIGTGTPAWDGVVNRVVAMTMESRTRAIGSTTMAQTMASGPASYLAGLLGLGNHVFANSSACNTGTEAIILGYNRIMQGKAERMLVGGVQGDSAYIWACFDSMRVLVNKYNDTPEKASRPLSASAAGFVPSAGAGILVIEDYETAKKRNAPIHAEIIGVANNCGGQRLGGSITLPNNTAVQRCILEAIKDAGIDTKDIDLISGHLTATKADSVEAANWVKALQLTKDTFPYINSMKSMIGHSLTAAGVLETIATVLQLKGGFVHPSINCEDLNPDVMEIISEEKIPQKRIDTPLSIAAKASFGFGDVNSCVILKRI